MDGLEGKLTGQMTSLQDRLSGRIDAVARDVPEGKDELTEVRIAVARLEGPSPRLVLAR